jgi:hypothetical protein
MKAPEMKNKALLFSLSLIILAATACSKAGTANPSAATTNSTTSTTANRTSQPNTTTPPASNTTAPAAPNTPASTNADLDFTLVNKTGYSIKEIYVGASGTGNWAKEDELLKGREFGDGIQVPIKFNPKETAEKWDLKVTWSDGSGSVEWLNLKLTEIDKLTLVYDKEKDETSAVIN